MVTAAAVYTFFAANDPVDFDAADNSPFAWEAPLERSKRWAAGLLRQAKAVLPGGRDGDGEDDDDDGSKPAGGTVGGRRQQQQQKRRLK